MDSIQGQAIFAKVIVEESGVASGSCGAATGVPVGRTMFSCVYVARYMLAVSVSQLQLWLL